MISPHCNSVCRCVNSDSIIESGSAEFPGKRIPKAAGFVTVLLALLLSLAGPQKVVRGDQIRWKFKAGDQYRVTVSQTTSIKSEVVRTKVNVNLALGAEMNWKVLSVNQSGNAIVEQVYDRLHVKVEKTAKPTIAYDTASKDPPEKNAVHFAEVYDQLIGIKFKVEMAPTGEIVKVDLDPKDLDTIRSIPESMEARKLFEKRGLVELLNGGGFVLPAESVEKGFQWPVRKTQKMTFGTAVFEAVFTYQGKQSDQSDLFSFQSKTVLTDQPKNRLEKPLVLKNQTQSGEIRFDNQAGYLRSIKINQKMETEKPFREMKITTDSSVDTIITITKVDSSDPK